MNVNNLQGEPANGERDAIPTRGDVAFFREHGYWISPPIVPLALLSQARHGMERLYAGDVDHTPLRWDGTKPPASFWGWSPEDGDGLRKNDYVSLRVDELAQLVQWPAISRTASCLSAGVGGVRLWHDQLLCKPIETAEITANVGWHVDRQYWRSCSSDEMLTAWVPFDDVTIRSGPVMFIDGSHRWPVVDLDFWAQDLDTLEGQIRRPGAEELVKVAATVSAGQVVFHHCKTIHGSGPNRSDRPRRAFAIHLQPVENRYVPSAAAHPNDELVRRSSDGAPDYADPRVCPRLPADAASG